MIVKGCFNGVSRVVYGCFEGAQDPFLAAMSSSRSDVVTQSVRVFVFSSLFFLLVSLKCLLLLKSFNCVSRQFKEFLKFNGGFKAVSRMF